MQLLFSLRFKELLKSQYLSSKAVFVSVVDCPFFYALMACKLSGSLIRGAGFQKQENTTQYFKRCTASMTQWCPNKSDVGQEASGEKFWFVAFTYLCCVNTFDGSQNSWLCNNKLLKLQHNHCDLEVGACHLWLSVRRIFLVNYTSFWVPQRKCCKRSDKLRR